MENCTAWYIEPSHSYTTHSPHAICEDPFASCGYNFFASTPSRNDKASTDSLPVYMEYEAMPPPSFSVKDEPVTLAMYMFKFGFLFPPFWILGAIIFFSPLRIPSTSGKADEWMPDKTDTEKQVVIDKIRRVELRWARRCLVALAVFFLLDLALGSAITIWAVWNA